MSNTTTATTGHRTLGDAIAAFLTNFSVKVREGIRAGATLDHHRENLAYLCERIPAATPLAQVDSILIDSVAVLEQEGRRVGADGQRLPICNGTLAKRLSSLRQVMRLARRRGWIDRVPDFPEVERRYRPRRVHLRGPDELARLLERLDVERGDWTYVAVFTGQRPRSIHSMRVSDVDPYGSPPWMVIRSHKTGDVDGQRVVMPEPLACRLRARLERRKLGPDDPLVDPWPKDPRCRALRPLGLRASDLRRTFAGWVAHEQGTLTVGLMRWLQHTDFSMLSRVYAWALPPAFGEVAEAASRAARAPRRSPHKVRPAGMLPAGKTKPGGPLVADPRAHKQSALGGSLRVPPLGRRRV